MFTTGSTSRNLAGAGLDGNLLERRRAGQTNKIAIREPAARWEFSFRLVTAYSKLSCAPLTWCGFAYFARPVILCPQEPGWRKVKTLRGFAAGS